MIVQRVANLADSVAERFGTAGVFSPDRLEQLLACDELARLRSKAQQYFNGLRGQPF
jgi:DNA-binding ferritin-like protein